MLLNPFVPFVVAALVVHARPHNNQPGGFWTPGSEMRAPLALHKVNQQIHPCGSKPAGPPPPFQAVPPFDGTPKIQAVFERERLALAVETPSNPIKDSAVKVGGEGTGLGRRNRRKRSLVEDPDIQEFRTTPGQIMDESNDDSPPVDASSSLNGVPILEKRLRHNRKRSFPTHGYKTLDPEDKTGRKDSYPVKGYAREVDSVKGANNATPETA